LASSVGRVNHGVMVLYYAFLRGRMGGYNAFGKRL
jgi:hypothetical protein